ncbi:hypothetical protein MMC07_002188 [Pseudocyphellaria aurata]|nr:hypothetical protein [Pseudocyphellaria aurata]
MIVRRILRCSSFLRLLTFLAIATFLESSGRKGYALALPQADFSQNDPEARVYPTGKEVAAAFMGVRIDALVLGAGVTWLGSGPRTSPGGVWLFATSTGRTSLYNAFQERVQPFLSEGYGPREGFPKFFELCTKFIIKRSSGKVYVLGDWPNGPDTKGDCNFWRDLQFPNLKGNINVKSIWLVDRNRFQNMKQIWPVDSKDTEEPQPDTPNRPSNRHSGGRPGFLMTPLTGLAIPSSLGLGAGLGGLGDLPLVAPVKNDPDPGFQYTPGVWGDALNDLSQKLPSSFDDAITGDKTSTGLGTGGTGGVDGNGNGNLYEDFFTPTRRHLGLEARFGPACDWSADLPPDWSPDPSSLAGSSPEVGQSRFAAPGAISDSARVQVYQYDPSFPTVDDSGHFHLAIQISNKAGETIGDQPITDAPPGEDVKVLSQLPYALRVSVGSGLDSKALFFKYAWDTPYRKSWDMYDTSYEHSCQIGSWDRGLRGVYCDFIY